MKRLIAIILALCTLSLSGCAVFQELQDGMGEAFGTVVAFCEALEEDNFDAAATLLHAQGTLNKENLSAKIAKLEQTHGIDFSDGITFKHRTSFSSSYYTSEYDGSAFEATYEILVGKVSVTLFFTVVRNDAGYGIYHFGLE